MTTKDMHSLFLIISLREALGCIKIAIEIKPVQTIDAEVPMPGSKSYTNRALLLAALAKGESTLLHPLKCSDTEYMKCALLKLGVEIIEHGDSYKVRGTAGKFQVPEDTLYLGNAGTPTRLLTGLATLCPGEVTITGDLRMQQRPISPLLNALVQLGVDASSYTGCPPVKVKGGTLQGGACSIRGDVSSQFISSLLMVAPYAKQDVIVSILGKPGSRSYIDITIAIMKQFGISVHEHKDVFRISNGQCYTPCTYEIEGDYSSASYFLAAAAVSQGKVKVTNCNPASVQGDAGFLDVLRAMGCKIRKQENVIMLTGPQLLRGVDVDMNRMPDTVQTLAVIASFAAGKTIIRNVGNLRIKETDRLHALATELPKAGVMVRENKEGLVIFPGKLHGATIETYDDHRMAMSFAVMGLKVPGIIIKNPECVAKSFPGFWDVFKGMGVSLCQKS